MIKFILILELFILFSSTTFAIKVLKSDVSLIVLTGYPKVTLVLDDDDVENIKDIKYLRESDETGMTLNSYSERELQDKNNLTYYSTIGLPPGTKVNVELRIRKKDLNNITVSGEYKIPEVLVGNSINNTGNVSVNIKSKMSNTSRSKESNVNIIKSDEKESFEMDGTQDVSSE